jgi:hypothetical protein
MERTNSYTYYPRGEQKLLEQTQRRGRRLSIIGFFQPLISFIYGLVIGGVNRKAYIQMMEQEAADAHSYWTYQGNSAGQWSNTSMSSGAGVMAKVGTNGFVPLLFAEILLGNESD